MCITHTHTNARSYTYATYTHTCMGRRTNQPVQVAVCGGVCVCAPVNNIQSGLLKIYLYMMFMMTATQSMSAHTHIRTHKHSNTRESVAQRQRRRPLAKELAQLSSAQLRVQDTVERAALLARRSAPPRTQASRVCVCLFHSFALVLRIEHTLNVHTHINRETYVSYQLQQSRALSLTLSNTHTHREAWSVVARAQHNACSLTHSPAVAQRRLARFLSLFLTHTL